MTPRSNRPYFLLSAVIAALSAGVVALLLDVDKHKEEARTPEVRVVQVDEDTTDPAVWGKNWPKQYDLYKLTAQATSTRFGGHGGSEALPAQKSERDPWLTRMFLGYAFSIDYRDRRGHAYMLTDQEETERQTKPQTGSCLHCHDPESMQLRVTRPGFIQGIQALAAGDGEVVAMPSIERWREGSRETPYDPNTDATRTEMRSYVCGQCHAEYYCSTKQRLVFPWGKGLTVEATEAFWNDTKFPDGDRFFDYKHKETNAPVLKAQHPEFELWSQGVHARSGVACADCHMPYMRDGSSKISDHWVRSPPLNVNRACQTCHHFSEEEMLERVDVIQGRNHALMTGAADALMDQLDARSLPRRRPASPRRRSPPPSSSSGRPNGASTSSRRRTAWASTHHRRRRVYSARPPISPGRARSRR